MTRGSLPTSVGRRVLCLGFGDIQGSRGARGYLGGVVASLRGAGDAVDAVFLQQYVPGVALGMSDLAGFTVIEPPLGRWAASIPSVPWRVYELGWGNWHAWRSAAVAARANTACLLVGPGVLPLAPWLRRRFARCLYVHHGIAEEFLLTGRRVDRLKFALNKRLERRYLRLFDAVVVVSERMAEYCRREYGVRHTVVVPCGVDLAAFPFRESAADRTALRRQAGVEGRFVFAYSGGAAPWQCVPQTVAFFRAARKRVPEAFLLVLSPDVDAWRAAVGDLDPAVYRVLSVPHAEVAKHLAVADAAFLLRQRSIINEVSAPVKFAEYLASGVPVITTPHVGDYSSMVDRYRVGVVMEPDDPTTWPPAQEALLALTGDADTRARCRAAAEPLAWDRLGPRLQAVLRMGPTESRAMPAPEPSRNG